ncbi:MAG: polysaccharide pyruvyl transferase family protein [Planctomycetota bacterium]
MLIQIHGGGFANRGAQLMLWTALDRLRERLPDARFCVEELGTTFQERAGYDLYAIAPRAPYASLRKSQLLFRFGGAFSKLLPKSLLERHGVVRRADVDALVDISGYAFGDKWPVKKSASMASRVASFHRKGKPVVLLPQMFGPFDRPAVADAFRPVVRQANLIYAREQPSLECLEKLNDTGRPLGLAPDITIFSSPIEPAAPSNERYACLVPNSKMIDQGKGTWDTLFVERMTAAGKRLESHGITPRVLIHDANEQDKAVGLEVLERLGRTADGLLIEPDPRKIKGIISRSVMLVGSRFHAIVASLSTGRPAIVMGWAHKYEALMSDFGTPEFMHRHDQPASDLESMIDQLADTSRNDEVSQRLADSKRSMKADNDAMWGEVIATLTSRGH